MGMEAAAGVRSPEGASAAAAPAVAAAFDRQAALAELGAAEGHLRTLFDTYQRRLEREVGPPLPIPSPPLVTPMR